MLVDIWKTALRTAPTPAAGRAAPRRTAIETLGTPEAPPAGKEGDRGSQPANVQSALEAIVRLIPTEVLGVYMGLVGLFGQSWTIFFVGGALIPVLLTITHFERKAKLPDGEPAPSTGKLTLMVFFAWLAYVPWAGTLPGTPFTQFHPDATKIAAGIALVLSPLLPRLAKLLKLSAD